MSTPDCIACAECGRAWERDFARRLWGGTRIELSPENQVIKSFVCVPCMQGDVGLFADLERFSPRVLKALSVRVKPELLK